MIRKFNTHTDEKKKVLLHINLTQTQSTKTAQASLFPLVLHYTQPLSRNSRLLWR